MSSKYQNGKIYKITDSNFTKMYIGSTTNELSYRFSEHRTTYNHYLKHKSNFVTVFSLFDEFGIDNCQIILVELCPCDSRSELHKKEGEHIKNNDCINQKVAGRSKKEWIKDNLEKYREDRKHQRERNQEHIKEYNRQYKFQNRDRLMKCSKLYREQNKERLNDEEHKIKHRVSNNTYYQTHKDKIRENRNAKSECQCGGSYTNANRACHFKSAKHLKWLEAKTL